MMPFAVMIETRLWTLKSLAVLLIFPAYCPPKPSFIQEATRNIMFYSSHKHNYIFKIILNRHLFNIIRDREV